MFKLSSRMQTIKASPTLALNAKASQLRQKGIDIVNLSTGEPEFRTPLWIQEGAIQSMQQGLTKYTAVDGIPALKTAIQKKLLADYNQDYDLDMITIGTGAKQLIFNALLASVDAGDEVIIPAPYWVSYPDIVSFCGGKSVFIATDLDADFKITPAQLRIAITPQTKWLILNSPNNPTGAVYNREELFGLAEVLMQHPHVSILSDDIYEALTYDDVSFTSIVCVEPRLKFRTLVLNGLSKTFAMTGWRLGYCAGPVDLIKAMNMLQSQSTSNPCSIAQGAAVAALAGPQNFLHDWIRTYETARDYAYEKLSAVPGLKCSLPKGAFYHFVNCAGVIGKSTPNGAYMATDDDIALYLLEHAKVVVVPGSAFGASPYFRISYTCTMDVLQKGCERIAAALKDLT